MVTAEEANELAVQHGILFTETSALSGENVFAAMEKMTREVKLKYDQRKNEESITTRTTVTVLPSKNTSAFSSSSRCC